MTERPPRARKSRLTRADWVDGALRLLAEKGPSGIAVEPLAATLSVTKGSFYWHFRDLADLNQAIREEWSRVSTDRLIRKVSGVATAAGRLQALLSLAANEPRGLERAIRAWAAVDAETASQVASIDARRTAYIEGLLAEIGYDKVTARGVARMLACFVVGETMCDLSPEPRYYAAIGRVIRNASPQKKESKADVRAKISAGSG